MVVGFEASLSRLQQSLPSCCKVLPSGSPLGRGSEANHSWWGAPLKEGVMLGDTGLSTSLLALTAVMLSSRSLHSNSPLDVSIKGQMIRDLLNLAGFVLPSTDSVASRPQTRSDSTCRSAPFSVRAEGQSRLFSRGSSSGGCFQPNRCWFLRCS